MSRACLLRPNSHVAKQDAFHFALSIDPSLGRLYYITSTPIRRHRNQRNHYCFVLYLAVVTCAVWIYNGKKNWKPSAHRKYIAAHHPAPSLCKTMPCEIYCTVPVDNKQPEIRLSIKLKHKQWTAGIRATIDSFIFSLWEIVAVLKFSNKKWWARSNNTKTGVFAK